MLSKLRFFRTGSFRPPRPLRVYVRSFSRSHFIRAPDAASPSSSTTANPASVPPQNTIVPPQSRFRFFRHFRYLKYVPYKTIIALTIVFYGATRLDLSMKESIEAILTQFTVPDNTWLYLNLNDLHITDSPHSERALQIVPFVSSAGKRRMTTLEISTTIMEAARDPRVKGLVLAFNQSMIEHRSILTGEVIESHLGMGVLHELHEALMFFAQAKRLQRKDEKPSIEPDYAAGEPEESEIRIISDTENERSVVYQPTRDVIIAISDNYTSGFQYSLASMATRILMQPSGQVYLTGMSMQQLFFGKVLQKYGIDYQVEARRDYKSGLAALSDSAWNVKTRENLEELLWSLQSQTLADLYRRFSGKQSYPSASTSPDPETNPELFAIFATQQFTGEAQKSSRELLRPFLDVLSKGPLTFTDAKEYGLVDGNQYHQDLLAELTRSGIKTWSVRKYLDAAIAQGMFGSIDRSTWVIPQLFRKEEKSQRPELSKVEDEKVKVQPGTSINTSLSAHSIDSKFEDHTLRVQITIPRRVGLIYLDNVIEGKGRFGGEAMAAYILKAARDPSIHSIVLRINSPGGDAVASDTIWSAVQMAKRYKPVVASFGDVAASGGYYAAAGADKIVSNPYTITGSIGVLSGWPVINRLLDKIDITSDSIQSMPNAAWRHMELGLPEAEMEKLRAHVDQTYEQFKMVVSDGRNMDMDQVEEVAQGQVFTGAQAVRLGLVDQLGSLTYALSAAGQASLERDTDNHEPAQLREYLSDEARELFDDALNQGDRTFNATVDALKASPRYKDEAMPTPEEIRKVLSTVVVTAEPKVEPVIIPHVNLANEALGVAISTAFQSEDERSPIPIDQPLVDPEHSPSKGKIIVGALLGIARSNNIPLWQFPMFCYWYAAQALGKVGDGMGGGLLDTWFAKLLTNQQAFKDILGNAKATGGVAYPDTVAAGNTAWNIRMEMPPLKIFA